MATFLTNIRDPFKIIKTNQVDFFIWVTFTIIAGQLGIFANFILRFFSSSNTLTQSIYLESSSGSFYTFSIALVASCLGPLFANFANSRKPKFSSLKVVTMVIAFLFLFFSGIIYSATQLKQFQPLARSNFSVDWVQLSVYLIAIFLVAYSYCLMKIDSPHFDYLESPSFDQEDDANVKEAISESSIITDDGSGVAL